MRLPPEKIQQILIAANNGDTRSAIATRLKVDISTVSYQIEQGELAYGTTRNAIYALVKPAPKVCTHPSLKCLICGKAQDHIHRRESEHIRHLTTALTVANQRLLSLGYEAIEISTL